MRLSREVLSSTSPIGVAPPVSDDCAPIGSTALADRRTSATSDSLDGKAIPAACPPGKWAASSRNAESTSGSRRINNVICRYSRPMKHACLSLAALLLLAPAASAQVDAPRITQQDFKKLVASNNVLIVDTRNADAYETSHIPGAVLLPLEGLMTMSTLFDATSFLKSCW